MSVLSVHSVTVSVEFGDKDYGRGNGRFMSAFAKVPEGHPGQPLDDPEPVIQDGIDLYFAAWQSLMQTRAATGEIGLRDYAMETAAFRLRLNRVRELHQKIRGYSVAQLEELLKKCEENNVQGDRHHEPDQG